MSVFKCKMCGGDLEIGEGNVAVCEYCGTKQTVPTLDNERKESLFGRAGRLLRACEFDKASVVFGDIVSEFPDEAEAYWGLLLCKYGVEYVDDPATGKKIPTCHRLSFNSVMEDADFEQALENADYAARGVYREEAKFLEELRRNVIEVSAKEEPYDVFICYKETDSNGDRTIDSVMAQDIYNELTEKGLKVFFARITLEDKLGMEYEPYIFAALNSAKVMLAIGTDYEYFNAVWVKNEWSRFLKLMANGEKKVLIPCYKGIDVYDMPKEFRNLQAQDMGKLGFMQDLIRGIKKIVSSETAKPAVKETVVISGATSANAAPLLRRVFIFLEDGDFANADEYCEKVLDMEPENAEAYLGKMMAELSVRKREDLALFDEPFNENANYKRALRFADEAFAEELRGYIYTINERKENRRLEALYKNCVRVMETSRTEEDYINAAKNFEELGSFRNSAEMAKNCRAKAEGIAKDTKYNEAENLLKKGNSKSIKKAKAIYESLSGWRDSEEKLALCDEKAIEATYRDEKTKIEKKRRGGKATIIISAVAVVLVAAVLWVFVFSPLVDYNNALELVEEKRYEEAIIAFEAMEGYKDSNTYIEFCENAILEIKYQNAVELFNKKEYSKVLTLFSELKNYKESAKYIEKAEFFIKAEEVKIILISADTNLSEKLIKELEIFSEAINQPEIMDCCYFTAAKNALKEKNQTSAERFSEKIKNSKTIEGFSEFEQELEYLKIYNEAKAIEIKNKDTKNKVKELCEKLPEGYEGKEELLEAVKKYEEKNSTTSTERLADFQGTWTSKDGYKLIVNGNYFVVYDSSGNIAKGPGYEIKGTYWCDVKQSWASLGGGYASGKLVIIEVWKDSETGKIRNMIFKLNNGIDGRYIFYK